MTTDEKFLQGTPEWFEMAGTLMRDAAAQAGLSPDLNVSMLERYTDGTPLSDGLVQGLRFDVIHGRPMFRIGVRPDERADVMVEVTAGAARQLNLMRSADPNYQITREHFVHTGEMHAEGDASRLGDWLDAVHDPIVDRTS